MSLRARIIALFCALALGPLAALGVADYVGAMRTLQQLVAAQTRDIAARVASELQDRYRLRESDLLLLAENAETQRLLRVRRSGDDAESDAAWVAADAYLRRAWEQFGRSFLDVELIDRSGAPAYRLGAAGEQFTGAARENSSPYQGVGDRSQQGEE
ncbi:MAG: hypothetical protein FIA95_10300, partial [Gemmatimonadetes bacterium]|nr:hypothetical protein [Gemmatimonadota bacterium]